MKRHLMIKKQQGYLILIAVFLIVVIGTLGVAAAFMIASGSVANTHFSQSSAAFYLAESGTEKATRYLLTSALSGSNPRLACASLDGNANLTDSSFGSGQFTVTATTGSPVFANSKLSSSITNSVTTIPVTSTSGFAPNGRLLIDMEAIDYAAISGNSFIGVIRGTNNTAISSHANGAWVSQYQCGIDSIGAIPSVSSPLYKRELQQNVNLQDAWSVGVNSGGAFVFTHWNYPTELAWTSSPLTNASNTTLNGISLLSNAEGWAAANTVGTNYVLLRLLGSTWGVVSVAGACSNQHLFSVSAVSSQEAWAVGVRGRVAGCNSGNYRYTILRWNGSAWSELSPSTSPSTPADGNSTTIQNLNHVAVISTTGNGLGNLGFAVGNQGRILQYNGTQWTQVTSPVTRNLQHVVIVSASEAWAVGLNGVILKWNGSSWSSVSSPTSAQLNAISMLDTNGDGIADTGWAVGNSGAGIYYNGSTWSVQNPGGGNLLGVAVFSSSDAWAVGASGRVTHWDGTSWTNGTSNVSVQLNDIAAIQPGSHPTSQWNEIFP